jgi:hypothetical protein
MFFREVRADLSARRKVGAPYRRGTTYFRANRAKSTRHEPGTVFQTARKAFPRQAD